jgi:Fic family protein
LKRAGTDIKNLSGESSYQSFRPSPLPPEPMIEISDEMLKLLVEANSRLIQLNTASQLLSNSDLFVSMYVRKEALISSQIEGTQCTLEDVLDPHLDRNLNNDVREVISYVKAAQFALDRLNELPLCNRLLKETHALLMENQRGQDKDPGEFRRSQNWIGSTNSTIKDARYIPPNVSDMNSGMSDLEKYINVNPEYDALIQSALIHYQFETIHPFLDGNGRIGRLLILLYLIDHKMLSKPVLYVSYFFKKNQVEYYDRLSEVRRSGNYEQWIIFFLQAVKEASLDAYTSIQLLSKLHDENIALLGQPHRKKDNKRLVFDYLEQHPIIDIGKTANALGITYNTVSTIVYQLIDLGILKESTNTSRNRIFIYEKYVEILRKDT